jgi:putative ABC transport system permease protein
MKTRDLTELALRNLREAILRNSLTTLGVAVGVASLVAMLSLGVGLQTLANKRLLRSGLFDSVLVSSGRGNRGGPDGPRRREARDLNKIPPALDDTALTSFQKLPNVSEVYPQIRFSTDIRYEGRNTNTNALGIPESSRKGEAFEGMTGKFFSSPTAEEAILQVELAKDLLEKAAAPKPAPTTAGNEKQSDVTQKSAEPETASPAAPAPAASSTTASTQPSELLGKTIVLRYAQRASFASAAERDDALLESAMTGQLNGNLSVAPKEKTLRIVGVIETDPSAGMGGFGGGRLYLPLQFAQSLSVAQPADMQALLSDSDTTKPAYTALTVRVNSPKDVAATEDAIKKMGYSAFSLLDATKGLRLVFTVFDLFLGLFGSLALTVASLGIINTLVMAILERRREIGVLKALGATDGDVKSLFFAEAAAMGFFGGLFGVALGWFIGQSLTWGTGIYLRQQDLPSVKISYVPWWLALGAIAFATIVSLLAGLYPAARAAKLNPVEALRYE